MALAFKTRVETLSTRAGSQSFTGAGFAPKAVLVEVANLAGAGFGSGLRFCVGLASGPANQGCEGLASEHNVSPSQSRGWFYTDRLLRVLSGAGTVLVNATLTSLDADGMTINLTTAPAAGVQVIVTYLGGSDLTNATTVVYNQPAAKGARSITGVGFRPDGMIALSAKSTGNTDSSTATRMSLGFVDINGGQALAGFRAVSGVSPSQTFAELRNDCFTNSPSDGVYCGWVSWDPDGWTENWFSTGPVTSDRQILALVWKGGSSKVVYDTQATAAGAKDTPLGLVSRGALLASVQLVAPSPFVEQAGGSFSLGSADGSTDAGLWAGAANGVSPTNAASALSTTKSLLMYAPASTVNAEAATSFPVVTPAVLRETYSSADRVARAFAALAFGDTTASASTSPVDGIDTTHATLHGIVNPRGLATTYHFEWGTTTAYGNTTADTSAGSGRADVAVSAALAGLTPNTIYHGRLIATTSIGTSYGADVTFVTAPTVTAVGQLIDSMETSSRSPFFLGIESGTSTATLSRDQAFDGVQSLLCSCNGGGGAAYARDLLAHDGGFAPSDDVYYAAAYYLKPGFLRSDPGNRYVAIMRVDNYVGEDGNVIDTALRQAVVLARYSDYRWHAIIEHHGVENVLFDLPAPPEGRWFWVELHVRWGYTPASSLVQVLVDGTPVGASSALATLSSDSPAPNRFRSGIVATGSGQTTLLELYLDRATMSPGQVIPTRILRNRPPLELAVEVTSAEGARYRWDSRARLAQDRPRGLRFTSATMEGFKTMGCALARRIDQDFPDLHLWDEATVIGADGSIAWEGRFSGIPRSVDGRHSIAVNAVGLVANMKDRRFRETYVDSDQSGWGPVSLGRRADLLSANRRLSDPSTPTDSSQQAIVTAFQGPWASPFKPHCEAQYDAGPGVLVGQIYLAPTVIAGVNPADARWLWQVFVAEDDRAAGALSLSRPSGYFTPASPMRYAGVSLVYDATPAGNVDETYEIDWPNTVIYGAHGLALIGADPKGVAASDVIRDLIRRFCPKLNADGVPDTTYPIRHLKFADSTYPYDAMLQANGYHLWNFAVWEGGTAYYQPFDLTDYDWEVRLTDPGVSVELQGDTTDGLANGIEVTYTDALTGKRARLTPDDTPELADSSASNEANRHGLQVWTQIDISSPVPTPDAVQLGRVALAEYNQPKAPGTITVTGGYLRDRAGHWQQGWKVRGSQRVAILDHPNARPRLITEAQWDHDTKTLTIATDSTLKRVDAILDRFGTALAAAGLA